MYVSIVWKYLCMSRLALFTFISGTILWNLIKLCMNINIGYAVILRFHDFHLGGQTKVAYMKICCKPSSFIWTSGSIFWNLTKLCMNVKIGYAVILLFHDFHFGGKTKDTIYIKIYHKIPNSFRLYFDINLKSVIQTFVYIYREMLHWKIFGKILYVLLSTFSISLCWFYNLVGQYVCI